MFSTLYHVKMAENINKLIDFLWINFWIIIYKNKNLKKIKLSAFCKIRLNVIQKKKNINIDLLNLLYFMNYILHILIIATIFQIFCTIKKCFEQNLLLKYK